MQGSAVQWSGVEWSGVEWSKGLCLLKLHMHFTQDAGDYSTICKKYVVYKDTNTSK